MSLSTCTGTITFLGPLLKSTGQFLFSSDEILRQGRSPLGRTLLGVQQELFRTFSRARKYRGYEEVLDFMIIRCLNILLRHRFARGNGMWGSCFE